MSKNNHCLAPDTHPETTMMIYADLEYDDGTTHRQPLVADESKKSVYWLKDIPPTDNDTAGTTNVKALTISADRKDAFLIGGFQMQGMAKCIKVYVDDTEKLIMSVRGIKSTRLQAFFKAQCVIPGGARLVADFVRLELEPAAAIHQIRWTIRMRDAEDQVATMPHEERNSNILGFDGGDADPLGNFDELSCERGQDTKVTEPPNSSSTSDTQDVTTSAASTVSTLGMGTNEVVRSNAGLSAPAVASLTQHMADLAAAMRELTATIKDHQQFLQERQGS